MKARAVSLVLILNIVLILSDSNPSLDPALLSPCFRAFDAKNVTRNKIFTAFLSQD